MKNQETITQRIVDNISGAFFSAIPAAKAKRKVRATTKSVKKVVKKAARKSPRRQAKPRARVISLQARRARAA